MKQCNGQACPESCGWPLMEPSLTPSYPALESVLRTSVSLDLRIVLVPRLPLSSLLQDVDRACEIFVCLDACIFLSVTNLTLSVGSPNIKLGLVLVYFVDFKISFQITHFCGILKKYFSNPLPSHSQRAVEHESSS